MYHPQQAGLEFVELTNIGPETIDLNMVSFTNGIEFTFGPYKLGPGQYVVVVEDMEAFGAKYGQLGQVAGQYKGNLSNAGEQIRLQDPTGKVILEFTYDDGWYKSTDGAGYSLVVRDLGCESDLLSQRSAWMPGTRIGGSPCKGE
ncbi:MAG: lamin tail domain-containing protein, partial [Sedimentisphaerales bacterium]|nr:lamin tail domain-containing protein [Sedimentisphaerales bacterium]